MSDSATAAGPTSGNARGPASPAAIDDFDAIDPPNPALGVVRRLPAQILASLTREQQITLGEALLRQKWRSHPVDIRITVPFFGKRYYFTAVAGREQRDRARLRLERRLHPLRKTNNVLFFLGLAGVLYVGIMAGVILYDSFFQALFPAGG